MSTRFAPFGDVDPIVVERILEGDALPASDAERCEVIRRCIAAGLPLTYIEEITGWRTARYLPGGERYVEPVPTETGWHAPGSWIRRAECAYEDADMFFAPDFDTAATEQALAVCGRCPVVDACLRYSLQQQRAGLGHAHGVWGGMTAEQREDILRGERTAAA
jgi:WhiB family redox-sensing transcriptional regulator